MSAVLALGLCLTGGAAVLLAGPVHRVRSVARAGTRAVPTLPWWARFTRDAEVEAAEWTALLRRLAALLQSGRSPAAAFEGAGATGPGGPRTGTGRQIELLCTSVAAAARLGLSVSAALAGVPAPSSATVRWSGGPSPPRPSSPCAGRCPSAPARPSPPCSVVSPTPSRRSSTPRRHAARPWPVPAPPSGS